MFNLRKLFNRASCFNSLGDRCLYGGEKLVQSFSGKFMFKKKKMKLNCGTSAAVADDIASCNNQHFSIE